MKKTTLITLLVLLVYTQTNFAQGITSYVEYSYDLAGNRYFRKILRLKDKPEMTASHILDSLMSKKISQSSLTDNVLLFPNPTRGQVSLKITGLNNGELAEYMLFTLSGQELKKAKTDQETTIINFDNFPPGIYLFNIKFKEKTEIWKVIKEY